MTVSVVRAFRHSGGLNAGTPFETASTPVIALQPSAKARMQEQDAERLGRHASLRRRR